jgi:hypothetical protein
MFNAAQAAGQSCQLGGRVLGHDSRTDIRHNHREPASAVY